MYFYYISRIWCWNSTKLEPKFLVSCHQHDLSWHDRGWIGRTSGSDSQRSSCVSIQHGRHGRTAKAENVGRRRDEEIARKDENVNEHKHTYQICIDAEVSRKRKKIVMIKGGMRMIVFICRKLRLQTNQGLPFFLNFMFWEKCTVLFSIYNTCILYYCISYNLC